MVITRIENYCNKYFPMDPEVYLIGTFQFAIMSNYGSIVYSVDQLVYLYMYASFIFHGAAVMGNYVNGRCCHL